MTRELVTPSHELSLFEYNVYNVALPEQAASPYRVNWETNEICNMPCGFCFADYHEGAKVHESLGLPARGLLNTSEAKALIYQTAQIGTRQFLFGGGDPFIRNDMPELVEYAAGLNLHVVVDTNGMILATRKSLYERVAPYLHQLGLSLDGASAETHNSFRETKGSFDRVLRLIALSGSHSYKLKINTIVTKENACDIPAMVDILAPYGDVIQRWSLDQFIPVNRGKVNEHRYAISDEEYLAVVEKVKELAAGRFENCTIGGGLKSAKMGTVMMFGPQGIPYVTIGDQKQYLPESIRTKPLYELVHIAEDMNLNLHAMNEQRYATEYYKDSESQKITVPETEQIPIFTVEGQFAGAVERADLYTSKEHHHRIVHNLAYLPLDNTMEQERIWIQRRSLQSSYLPGYLVTTAGGHVNMSHRGDPETFEEAIQRELAEEVFNGIVPADYAIDKLGSDIEFLPDYPGYGGGKKQVAAFISETDGRHFHPAAAEVADLFPISVGELKKMSRDPNSLLHPELREIMKKKMIRIGIVGTYSVGKTTLTEALSSRIIGARGITEDVRTYVRNVFNKRGIQELTPGEFIALEHMLYKDQTVASRFADVAVIDSTPIGCPVYLENYGVLAGNNHRFSQDIIEGWREKTRSTADEYDVIVYIPPEIPFEHDGFRTAPEFRTPIDTGFQKIIANHPRVIEVTGYVKGNIPAGVQQRVNTVLNYCLHNGILNENMITR